MRYAIVEDGIVTNVAAAEEPFGDNWVRSDTAEIGDLYDGETFTPPPAPPSDVEAAWSHLRVERNGRLAASDWTQLADAPLTDDQKMQWAVYRQELRDLPTSTIDPFYPPWPQEPA